MTYYSTAIDGMRTISVNEIIQPDDYVTIFDKIYNDDNALFKVKDIKKDNADIRVVKTAETILIDSENVANYKPNQQYEFNGILFTSAARLSKKQIIFLVNSFYEIEDIQKRNNEANLILLNKIEPKKATNIYTIYKREANSSKEEKHLLIDNYREAIITLSKLRSQNDGNFYRFM